jgi:hypothetical protein
VACVLLIVIAYCAHNHNCASGGKLLAVSGVGRSAVGGTVRDAAIAMVMVVVLLL